MDYTNLPRKIQNPYWGNKEKTQVICEFSYEGGPILTAAEAQNEFVHSKHVRPNSKKAANHQKDPAVFTAARARGSHQ